MPRKTGLDDGELRVLKKRTRSVKVRKRSHQSHNSESRSTLDNAVDNPGESDKTYLRRYHAAQLPISFAKVNPKKKGSKSWDLYEKFKSAKTIEEALKLGIISLPTYSTAEMVRNPLRRILKPISKRKGNNPFQI